MRERKSWRETERDRERERKKEKKEREAMDLRKKKMFVENLKITLKNENPYY